MSASPRWATIADLSASVYVLIRQGWTFSVQTADLAPLLILGLVNTGIGCFLYFSSIGDIPVQSVAILGYLEPLSAILFSFLFLGEHLYPIQIAGALCIIAGAVGAERKQT